MMFKNNIFLKIRAIFTIRMICLLYNTYLTYFSYSISIQYYIENQILKSKITMGCSLDTEFIPDTPNGRSPFSPIQNHFDSTNDKQKFGNFQNGVSDNGAHDTQNQDQYKLGNFLIDKFRKKDPSPGNGKLSKSLEKQNARKSLLNIALKDQSQNAKRPSTVQADFSKINFSPLIGYFRQKYRKYRKQAPQKETYGMDDLKQEIRSIYLGLIKQKISQTNDNKVTIEECKIEISQQALQVQVACLKFIMQNGGFKMGIHFFEEMGYFWKQMTGFLKTKYPRSQVLDSGQLGKQIKEINATQQYQYDMLKNAGFCFNTTDQLQITRTIKLFLNKIIDQLQSVYPKFKQLLESSFSQEKNKLLYTNNYKIGRKISQNTAKYTKLQTGTIEVKSAQIQRVLIKWLQDLSQMIMKPRQIINQKNEYKFYSSDKSQSRITFTKCTQNKCQQLIQDGLISKVQQYTSRKRQKQQQMRRQFNEFNMNLINIFNLVEHTQHQVSKQEMQVIKFSYYNSDFISWIVEQQIIHSIKTLVEIGQKYSESGTYLDLIKFKINDLMRCQFYGNKKKIMLIYKEFQRLDKIRALEIIKIKNRFETMMGDAMIFFKLPGSFIICECQLILSNDSKGEDAKKHKNIEILNHFFYELERSPFGVLGQLGVFMKSKAETVSGYCHIIELTRQKNIKECLAQHRQPEIIEEQLKPFVCSKCVKFYPKFSNLFKIHECEACLIKVCNDCLALKFQITEPLMKKELLKKAQKFQQEFKQSQEYKSMAMLKTEQQKKQDAANMKDISLQKYYDKKLKEMIDAYNAIQTPTGPSNNGQNNMAPTQSNQPNQYVVMKGLHDVFKDKRIKMKDLFKSNKIKVQLIINYLQKEYQSQLKNDEMIMFIIATWKQKQLKFKLFEYNAQQNNIVNCYQKLQKYEKHEFIQVNDYDLILQIKSYSKQRISQIKKQQVQDTPPSIFQKGIYIFDGQDKNKILQTYNQIIQKGQAENENYILYYEFTPFYLIIEFDHSIKGSKSEGWVQNYLNSIPDLFLFRKNIQLNNQSIHNRDLLCFAKLQWVLSIKILNLNQNKISDISVILDNCINIEELSIRENKIKELVFNKPLLNLKYLNAGKNQSIERVKKMHNILNIQDLDLSDNKIAYIIMDDDDLPIIEKVEKAKRVEVKQNVEPTQANKPNKENKQNSQKSIQGADKKQKKNKSQKAQQKQIVKAQNKQLVARLQKKKKYQFQYLTKLNLTQNKLQSILQFSISQYPAMAELYLNDNQLVKLPQLFIPKLKKLDVSYNSLSSIDDFVKSQLHHLVELYLNDNKFKRIPPLKYVPKLKKIDLCYNEIRKLDEFMKGDYPQLTDFYFTENMITSVPKMNTPKIQSLHLDSNDIQTLKDFVKGQYPQLVELNLWDNKLTELPALVNMPNLKKLDFAQNQIQSVQKFAQLTYPSIIEIDLKWNKLTKFPAIKTPNLHKIILQDNLIENIKEFAQGDYPKLTAFSISYRTCSSPEAMEKKPEDDDEIICIENISKPKQSEKDYSQREKLTSQRGTHQNPFQHLIKQISQGNHPSAQDYYKTFLQAQQKKPGKDDVIQAAIFKNIGKAFIQQQNYQKAIQYYNRSLQLIKNKKGQQSLDYSLTLVDLAQVYTISDDFDEAETRFTRALQGIEKIKGRESQHYVETLLKVGGLYLREGENAEALQVYYDCLKLQEKVKRKDSIECSEIMKKIGQCFFNQGDYIKSLQNYERCLKIQLKLKGKRTKQVAQTILRIGSVHQNKGDYPKALQYYQKGVQIQKKVDGQQSQKYAINLYAIIQLYTKQNQFQKAIQLSQRYYQIMVKNKGEQSQECTEMLDELAGLHIRIGTKEAYEKALGYHQRCLAVQEGIIEKHEKKWKELYEIKELGEENQAEEMKENQAQQIKSRVEEHHQQQRTQTNINQSAIDSKRSISPSPIDMLLNIPSPTHLQTIQQQQKYLTPQQAHFKQQKRNNHYNMAITFNNIGTVYQLLNQNDNALKVYQRCYQILQYIQGDQSQNSIVVLDRIGNIYYKHKGEYHKAIQNYQCCLQTKESLYGQDSNGCIKTLQVLAELHFRVCSYEKALNNIRKCHKLLEQNYGEENIEVVKNMFKMAEILIKLPDLPKALETLEKCMKLYEKIKTKDSIQVAEVIQKLAEVYDCQNFNKKAIDFCERSLALKQKLKGQDCVECVNNLMMLSKVFMEQKAYEKSADAANRGLRIIQNNSNTTFQQAALLYYYLGQVALMGKESNTRKAIQLYQKSIQTYKKTNPYIFIILASQSPEQQGKYYSPYPLYHPFYQQLLQKLANCYQSIQQNEKALQRIQQCYEISKYLKGQQNDNTKRLLGKMIKLSGESFANEIIGSGSTSTKRQVTTVQVKEKKETIEVSKEKAQSLDNLRRLILGGK